MIGLDAYNHVAQVSAKTAFDRMIKEDQDKIKRAQDVFDDYNNSYQEDDGF